MTAMDSPRWMRLHEADNVAIVANDGGLASGARFPDGLELVERVPQGHKVALVDLKKGEADVAIRQGPSEDEELIARRIGDVQWSLYASEAYLLRHPAPADPRQLAPHDVLGFEERLAGVPGARWIAEHGAGANIVMRCRELTDMLSGCVAGLGLAVLPATAAALEPSLRRLTDEVLGTSGLWIVYRKEVLLAEPVRVVIEFAARVVREYLDSIPGRS